MSGISTHVLDLGRGVPAAGVPVALQQKRGDSWVEIGSAKTDDDGRCRFLASNAAIEAGVYRLVFLTGATLISKFYPEIVIIFETAVGAASYHLPLLFSSNGYTTYRGS